ncbi:MAG TPA: histidine phosphatase family protein [Mycobacteriales bacterium]|jgi:probable phosphoglycerate mutase|nr:histidine phosphatase family protein [Mycobacteriales bacterium]
MTIATLALVAATEEERSAGEPEVYRQYRFSLPPGATDLLVVRHGESAPARLDEPAPKADGHSDPPLAPEGEKQAERLAERLAHEHIDAIYVTSLQRTAQTAAPLAQRLGLQPIVEPDLREVFLGEWEGVAFRKYVAEGHPTAVQMFLEKRWDVIPGAESNDDFAARVRAGMRRIIAKHPGERVVVVVHGGVIGQLMGLASGAPSFSFIGADNASITQVVAMPEPWIIRRFNDTAHLDATFSIQPAPLT